MRKCHLHYIDLDVNDIELTSLISYRHGNRVLAKTFVQYFDKI
jgi:hypothetical protein